MRKVKTYTFCLPNEALDVIDEVGRKMGWPNASRSQILTYIIMNYSFDHLIEHGRKKEEKSAYDDPNSLHSRLNALIEKRSKEEK